MHVGIKSILKKWGWYHPLHNTYRGWVTKCKKIYLRQRYKKYKGSGYTCNCCGHQYAKMHAWHPAPADAAALEQHSVIAGYGENIICPWCLSTARERLVIAMLQQAAISHKKILHLSPEPQIHAWLKTKATVTTADLEPGFYSAVDAGIQAADATALPYANESFDWVIANHILEHIPADTVAMQELYRVLKKGGRAVLQVPYSTSITNTLEEPGIEDAARQSALFGQKDHVRIYQLQDYINRLSNAGFSVQVISYNQLQQYYQYAIQPDEDFLIVQKPV